MLGIDTNILVRFLVRDDEAQYDKARKLIKREVAAGHRVFVNHLVLMETEWVLRSRYAVPKNQIITAISSLLDATDVQFEDEPTIEEAVARHPSRRFFEPIRQSAKSAVASFQINSASSIVGSSSN